MTSTDRLVSSLWPAPQENSGAHHRDGAHQVTGTSHHAATRSDSEAGRRSIVLGVTADESVHLLRGFPEYLASRGWLVHLVSSPGPLSQGMRDRRDVQVHSIEMERRISPVKDLLALISWIHLLYRLKPDVLYVGTPKAGLLGGLAGVVARTPVRIYLLRGLRAEGLSYPWSTLVTSLERVSVWCAHQVVCVSNSLRTAARDAKVLAAGMGVVLGEGSSNGVFTDVRPLSMPERVTGRSRYFTDPARFTVGFVGRVTRDKGLDTLAEALRRLTQGGLTGNCLIIGGDDSRDGPQLRAALDGSGWSICHLGHVADVTSALAVLDVLCLPSRREGFPNVVLEAAVLAVPCVGSDATGVVDAIVDGVTGLSVSTGDVRALAEALAVLASRPGWTLDLGRAARDRAVTKFAREQVWAVQASFLTASLPSAGTRLRSPEGVHV